MGLDVAVSMATDPAFAAMLSLNGFPPASGVLGGQSIAEHAVMRRLQDTQPGATLKIRAGDGQTLTTSNKDTTTASTSSPGAAAEEAGMRGKQSIPVQHGFDSLKGSCSRGQWSIPTFLMDNRKSPCVPEVASSEYLSNSLVRNS